MQNKDDNELENVRQEHCNQVLERYKSTYKSFRRGLSSLIGFAIAFFLIILFPYFSIQHENNKIDKELNTLSIDIAQRQKDIDAYQKVINGIKQLRDEIKQSPNRLRNFILSLSQSPNAQSEIMFPNAPPVLQQQMLPQEQRISEGPCSSLERDELLNCQVRQEILRQFKEYENIIVREVIIPLENLDDKSASEIDTAALQEGINNLHNSFERELENNPRFWETFREKVGFSVRLDEAVTRFWSEYDTVVGNENEKLQQELKFLEDNKATLGEKQKKMQEQKKEIAVRVSQIETPLGKLPVGLSESILVFPIVLAIGFLIVVTVLNETIGLRKAFHTLYQEKDPDQAILTDKQVVLIAPLWIDPADTEQNKTFRFIVLIIPFVIFTAACLLIFYIWTIAGSFTGTSKVHQWVYSGLYVLSLGAFVYGYLQAIKAIHHYAELNTTTQ